MRIGLRPLLGTALGLLVAARSPVAAADDPREESRAAFRRGVASVQAGSFAAARDAFLEAYRRFPHPSILLNLGIARWRTGEYVEAEQDLARFLSDDGGATADEVSSARGALAHVRENLGTLRLRVAPAAARATLDGRGIPLEPGRFADVRVVSGAHVLVAEAPDHTARRRDVVIAAGAPLEVDLALAVGESRGPDPSVAAPPPARDATRVAVGWSVIGVAIVAAGVGTYAGVRALGLADDYATPGRAGYQDHDTRASGILLRTVADVAFASSIATAAVGAYLVLVPGRGRAAAVAPGASLRIAPGRATLYVSF